MPKTSAIEKNNRRIALVEKYRAKRQELKAILANPKSTDEEFFAAQKALAKLPRNSSKTRIHNRCELTGRPRGYFRKFGLCRNKLREVAMRGEVPGMIKASW